MEEDLISKINENIEFVESGRAEYHLQEISKELADIIDKWYPITPRGSFMKMINYCYGANIGRIINSNNFDLDEDIDLFLTLIINDIKSGILTTQKILREEGNNGNAT